MIRAASGEKWLKVASLLQQIACSWMVKRKKTWPVSDLEGTRAKNLSSCQLLSWEDLRGAREKLPLEDASVGLPAAGLQPGGRWTRLKLGSACPALALHTLLVAQCNLGCPFPKSLASPCATASPALHSACHRERQGRPCLKSL